MTNRNQVSLKGAIRTATDPKVLQSIMASHEASTLSNKYQFIPSTKVIDIVTRMGWEPVAAQEKRVRLMEREGYQKHMVRFRQPGIQPVNGVFPEVLLTNSHDGSASFTFMAGLFRLVCTNGLIVSEGMFGSIRVRHMNFDQSEVIDAVEHVVRDTPALLEHVDIFQHILVSQEEQFAFAESALNMKFQNKGHRVDAGQQARYQIEDRTFDLTRLIQPQRSADADRPSLWNTFNVVQEKFTKGAIFEDTVRRDAHGIPTHVSKVRGIKGIDESIRVNKELWGLAEKMADLKGGI
jgi:uncharacterized protein DUF932